MPITLLNQKFQEENKERGVVHGGSPAFNQSFNSSNSNNNSYRCLPRVGIHNQIGGNHRKISLKSLKNVQENTQFMSSLTIQNENFSYDNLTHHNKIAHNVNC